LRPAFAATGGSVNEQTSFFNEKGRAMVPSRAPTAAPH